MKHIPTPPVFHRLMHIEQSLLRLFQEFIHYQFVMSPRQCEYIPFHLLPKLGSNLSNGLGNRTFGFVFRLLPGLGSNFAIRMVQAIEVFHVQEVGRRETCCIRVDFFQIPARIRHEFTSPTAFCFEYDDVSSQAPIEFKHCIIHRHGCFYSATTVTLAKVFQPMRIFAVQYVDCGSHQ